MNPQQQNYWQGDEGHSTAPVEAAPGQPAGQPLQPTEAISWQASEYIHHQKSLMWYVVCVGLGAIAALISFIALRSWTFLVLILVITLSVVIYGQRPPRTMNYRLSPATLSINDVDYRLHDFRAFGIVQDGPLYSVILLPLKRFMPSINLYFPPEAGEQIVDRLGAVLPMESFEPDLIDRLVRKIRF